MLFVSGSGVDIDLSQARELERLGAKPVSKWLSIVVEEGWRAGCDAGPSQVAN